MARPGKWFVLLAAILSLFVVAGIAGYFIGEDNMNNDVFWGLGIATFVTLVGVSCGGAIVTAFLRVTNAKWGAPISRIAEALAVVALVMGVLVLITDMGHPEQLWRIFVTPNVLSPILWDTIVISLYFIATLILFYLPLIPDQGLLLNTSLLPTPTWRTKIYSIFSLGWKGLPQQQKPLSMAMKIMPILTIPMVVFVHSVLGWAFAVNIREGWNSTIFGPYFVIAALLSGVAADILIIVAFRKAYRLEKFISTKVIRYLGYTMMALGMTYLYFTFAELLTAGYAQTHESVPLIVSLLAGGYAPFFWFFVVGAGLIPVLLVALPKTRNVRGITIAAALVVAGMLLKRVLIVVPPLRTDLFLTPASSYIPSWSEIAITVGAFAAIPLVMMFIFRIFPILSIHEMNERAAESEGG
jgi:molybdopterin-containing oxidoreductase family membrane subunit